MSARAAALVLFATACAPVPKILASPAPPAELARACAGRDGWSDAAPPARIHGDTFYVGTCGITAILIASPRGHVLIDGATAKAAPAIAGNIERLGFRLSDVKLILASHEHLDHVGGLAELQRRSGAAVRASPAATPALASGRNSPGDPQFGALGGFPPVRTGTPLRDGEAVGVGLIRLTARFTPGHAPGGTSWSWRSCEGRACLTIVYADSLTAVSADGYRFGDHPERVAALRAGADAVAALDCDLLVTPHPAASHLFARLAGAAPLIDRNGCADYAARGRAGLAERLAKEAKAVSWRVTLPCTRAEAEALAGEVPALAGLDPPPVLTTSEPDPERPDAWRLDAYVEDKPDAALVALLAALAPSASVDPLVERIEDEDWVTLSQQGLEPIRAGRFFVHTPAHRHAVPADAVAFEINAGRAFGTGQHETTTGCLLALERLKAQGANFRNILDLGTGTGLLAFAAMRLWPLACAAASDIDPVAIEVAAENAAINGVMLGRGRGRLELVVACGLAHRRLAARAPYDLVIANILAGPLIDMAPAVARVLAPGGRLILAGLLHKQVGTVGAAYRRQGGVLALRVDRGDWPALVMHKRRMLARTCYKRIQPS